MGKKNPVNIQMGINEGWKYSIHVKYFYVNTLFTIIINNMILINLINTSEYVQSNQNNSNTVYICVVYVCMKYVQNECIV